MSHARSRQLDADGRARRGQPSWLSRVLSLLVRLVVLGILLVVFLVCRELGEKARAKSVDQAAHEAELSRTKAAAEEQLRLQKEREERLLTDPGYVESVARDELGLARPGETVILLDDPAPPKTAD